MPNCTVSLRYASAPTRQVTFAPDGGNFELAKAGDTVTFVRAGDSEAFTFTGLTSPDPFTFYVGREPTKHRPIEVQAVSGAELTAVATEVPAGEYGYCLEIMTDGGSIVTGPMIVNRPT